MLPFFRTQDGGPDQPRDQSTLRPIRGGREPGHRSRFGLVLKMFFLFVSLMVIFYFTTVSILFHIKDIVGLSRNVVTSRFDISSRSESMIDNLLSMEENQKKFQVLGKEEYRGYFLSALGEYSQHLAYIKTLRPEDPTPWETLSARFADKFTSFMTTGELPEEEWIDESTVNEWIQLITKTQADNAKVVEAQMRTVYAMSQEAERLGDLGLASSVLLGFLGSLFLAYSIHRPLRELRRGIRSFSRDGDLKPVRTLSRDELGELAQAFNEMAARLNQEESMRSDFISMLSHEIRTPLTSIREAVSLMNDEVLGPVNDRQRRFLDIAATEIERITNLLSRLMRVSSLAANPLQVTPKTISVAELVEGSAHRLLPAAQARDIEINPLVEPRDMSALGDMSHLQQVLLNLMGNAIKFSPPGSSIQVRALASPQGEVQVCVSDNGPGIPPEEQAYVFHRYFRGSRIKDEVDGIGLGLNISKHIVEAHGGSIWVESRPGSGSTFCFTLKAA